MQHGGDLALAQMMYSILGSVIDFDELRDTRDAEADAVMSITRTPCEERTKAGQIMCCVKEQSKDCYG